MQGASVRDARTSTTALEPDVESGKSTSFARLTDEVLGPTQRGVRNVLRSPVRLVLVAAILGISLMFVAVMVDLNASVQQRLSTAQSNIGTGITIRTAGSGGFGGASSSSGTTYITAAQVNTIEHTTGVTSISEYVTTRDTSGTLKGSVAVPTNVPSFGGGASPGGNGTGGAGGPFGGGGGRDDPADH